MMQVYEGEENRFVTRSAFVKNHNIIGDTTLRGKMYQAYPRESHVAEYRGLKFLITHSLAHQDTTLKYIEPYTGYFPKVVLMWRNFKERYLCKK